MSKQPSENIDKREATSPKLSVIIPMFNEQRYILRCLKSLKEQSNDHFEIILVDDGSTDDTLQVVDAFLANAKFKKSQVQVLHQKRQGPGAARNLGARTAKGEILILIDADMVFDKNYLQELTLPLKDDKVMGTFHGTEKVANSRNIWARCWSIDRMPNCPEYSGVYRAIRKKHFLSSKGFDAKKGYFDDDLASILGKQSRAVPSAICYHNNPETLGEAFQHSVWVGKSFARDTRSLKDYLFRFWFILLCMILGFGVVLYTKSFIVIPLLILALLLLVSLKRTVYENYPLYLLFLPILLVVRFTGYLLGAVLAVVSKKY